MPIRLLNVFPLPRTSPELCSVNLEIGVVLPKRLEFSEQK